MSAAHPSEIILDFDEARAQVEQHARQLPHTASETLHVLATLNRVLAEDIYADRDLPPFARATRDGYAVRAADVAAVPATLRVIGQVKAGSALPDDARLTSGTCVEIMTGAPVPLSADAVMMVEYTSASGDNVTITRTAPAGENIVPRGSEAKCGQLVMAKGTRLNHAQVAVATSVGRAQLAVHKKPRIAVLSTGDEIVDVSAIPGPYQIRNSNSFSLAAQVMAAGAEPVQLPVAPDEPRRLRELIAEGLECDLLLLSGGVSMGKYDLVEQALRDLDGEFFFTGARIQPGKPVVFGHSKRFGKLFLGLPGNPLSTMVTFTLFARPLIDALCGAPPAPLVFAKARITEGFRTKPGLTRFLPAILRGPHPDPRVELIRWQGSGDVVSMSRSNCLAVVPPDKETIAAGELMSVLVQ
jgi:molybdopterin molybdotransferase